MTAPAPREGGRRTLHLASGALGPLAMLVNPPVATAGFAVLLALAVLLEALRFASAPVHEAIARAGGGWLRPAEAGRVSGATWLAAGYLLTWLLFPPASAARAITVTAVCDPAAALVGRRFGRAPGRKTWIGTLAAFVAAALVLFAWRTAPLAALLAALAAALVERLPLPGADNVAIPLAAAAVLRLA